MRSVNFFDSFACRSRVHCETCQNEGEAGRHFRKSLGLNIDGVDCLHKCDHDFKLTGETSKEKVCKSCKRRDSDPDYYIYEHIRCKKCDFKTKRRIEGAE